MVTFSHFNERLFLQRLILTLTLSFSFLFSGYAQSMHQHRVLRWNPSHKVEIGPGDTMQVLSFTGAASQLQGYGSLPVFVENFPLNSADDLILGLSINNPVYQMITSNDLSGVTDLDKISSLINPKYSIGQQRNNAFLSVSFVPVRKNPANGKFEKLISFDLVYQLQADGNLQKKALRSYADHSVLSAGTWFKMSIPTSGIYIINAKDLKNIDPAFSSVDPATIQVFGNDGAMLAEANSTPRIDDLRELPIQIVGADPTKLGNNDYIIFYAKGPDAWKYSTTDSKFHHTKNFYTDYSSCFLTYGQAQGKRVVQELSTTDPANTTIQNFNDYISYEPAEINLIKTGRAWYSKDLFELTTTRDYAFTLTDIDVNVPVSVSTVVAAHCTSSSTSFVMSVNGSEMSSATIPVVGSLYTDTYAIDHGMLGSYTASGSALDIRLDFNRPPSDGIGYLKSIELNYMRKLNLSGGQVSFRSIAASSPGQITDFQISAGSQPVSVWDVSDPGNVKSIGVTQNNNIAVFRVHTDTLMEFTAFDGSLFNKVQGFTKIDNQNLHGTGKPDLVIVTNPAFMSQANELADFHRQHDNMNVLVTTPDIIYNEFSSGAQDITAIRDFMKMIYDRSNKAYPRYVLLFGDASYDYKNRVTGNTNFVPTYESDESLDPVGTFVTDDYFGLLDDGEGQGTAGFLDIGVGRFPVQTADQAESSVKKVIHYCANSDTVKNDWRNIICFVAEDYDNGYHESNADAVVIPDTSFNEDKIYMGAYDRISTPGGLRYPEVNDAITRRMESGCLMMNYVGHGGVLGWAHARVLEIPQIKAWSNFNNMPVFLTATCEFSYFDDPSFISAGEEVFLNPQGGGIALLTTSRPTYADGNAALTAGVYNNAFIRTDGKYPTLGDLIMKSKNYAAGGTATDPNTRKFVLLGDPALQMAYPQINVVTTSIATNQPPSPSDTLKALLTVTITGEIQDNNGNKATGFNGTVFPTIYDKNSSITTVPLEGESPFHFLLRKNILYKGKIAVVNGDFSFSFIVPKDIAYNFGGGKISYYARSASTDANGYDMNIIVGGFNNNATPDVEGPSIRLFMNDTNFVSGGLTDQNPNLLAFLSDSSGINTVGNGIGHDLTATLDNDTKSLQIMNDYYVADLNTFKKGLITYPFMGLSDGMHTVTVKVWDVYNNSSEASLDFLVASSAHIAVQKLLNYPNPFREGTTFSFEYNDPNTELTIQIDIYSLSGQRMKTLREPLFTNGYRANTITWNGCDDNGAKIGSGTYVYNISITSPDGSTIRKSSKLVVIR
jgi:hypothetical protein